MKISFSTQARIAICQMIRDTHKNLPIDDENRKMGRYVILKLRFPVEEQTALQKEVVKQGPDAAILNWPWLSVDLDSKEADYLLTKIKGHGWGPEDDDWFDPLLPMLEQAKRS